MSGRSFLLVRKIKDISNLEDGDNFKCDNEVRYNIPWSLGISKNDGFLGFNLHCEKQECEKKWTFDTKFIMKLVAGNGKCFRRTVQHKFQKPEGHGMDKFISWENLLKDYVVNNSIIIEIYANIVNSTGFFDIKHPPPQPYRNVSFLLKHTFKNISKFVENERDFSDPEDHYNMPWRIEIQKSKKCLLISLNCDKEIYEERKWSIECLIDFRLISANGKFHSEQRKAVFENKSSGGCTGEFISWNDLEKDYVTNDCIDVEVRVTIEKITDEPCTKRTFALSETLRNLSRIEEEVLYSLDIQNCFNIPWTLLILKENGFIGLVLRCEKEQCESRNWSIEIAFQLKIVSPNGRSAVFSGNVIDEPICHGTTTFITWDNLENNYIVNDTFIVEAQVDIIKMTGIEDETMIEKLSKIVIH
ncbi:MATH domain-containing protein [Caenorhabditis elegans]|uniref:MATH domain-containing protein n=1 Tax=Caenorhabditis elegans TaxID=6239 RepID=F3NWW4_CAEEL|nr:MATH domain-containing protein [Caenorhabditis elegans]CCD67118.1 MATH domain-containing protein [Caenorhabditis elegans]|eukprot:NP_494188.4 MATH (meprin-associated Traf homology) domain containing [Caenorhabditis elegans]